MDEPDSALDQTEADGNSEKLRAVHQRAMRRFDDTVTPQLVIRASSLQARRFTDVPGAMWEGEWGEQFANSIKVEVNKVLKGVRKIESDYRQNRIVPDFRPAGKNADQDTADTLDGLHRADSYHFKAGQARDNAFFEAIRGGFGAYRLTNELADPYDKDSDEQRINPGLIIVDADQRVFFDGNSKLYDKSDARFAFVITALTKDAFSETYGEDKATDWPEGVVKAHYPWFTPDVNRVCEYYEVEDRDAKLLILTHKISGEEQREWASEMDADELKDLKQQGWTLKTVTRKRRRVHKYTLSGAEVLRDHGYIAGCHIPVVPVYGNRSFIDNQEYFTGYVQPKMDSQRIYNGRVSKLMETAALAPREVPIFAPEQIPPNSTMAEQWARANIDRVPFLYANPLIDPVTGQIITAGPIGKVDPPQLQPVEAALLQIADNDLTEDQQDGAEEVKANTSEEAMQLAASRVDAKSGIYLDNMRQSVTREAEIYLSMCEDVYFEEGRTVETMSEEGDDGEAVLKQPYTNSEGVNGVRNDFSKGKYKVICDVTEATSTRRDKTVKAALNLASVAIEAQDLEMAQAALNTAVMNMDGEGTGDLQKFARKRLVASGIVEPTEEEQQQMEEAAAQPQQPDPNMLLAMAQAQDLQADARLKGVKAVEAGASAALKHAQAVALGGPEEAPQVPTGLEQAATIADVNKKNAEAEQIRTQTAHLPHKLAIEQKNADTKAEAVKVKIRRGSE